MNVEDAHRRPLRRETSRRSFIRFFAGGLAVAVPSLYTLTSAFAATPACAATCQTVYAVYRGQNCGRFAGTCPQGNNRNCIGHYDFYCTCSGQYCFSTYPNLGPCGGD
jgi:hypothetical protein